MRDRRRPPAHFAHAPPAPSLRHAREPSRGARSAWWRRDAWRALSRRAAVGLARRRQATHRGARRAPLSPPDMAPVVLRVAGRRVAADLDLATSTPRAALAAALAAARAPSGVGVDDLVSVGAGTAAAGRGGRGIGGAPTSHPALSSLLLSSI